jgi:hypothetical protein
MKPKSAKHALQLLESVLRKSRDAAGELRSESGDPLFELVITEHELDALELAAFALQRLSYAAITLHATVCRQCEAVYLNRCPDACSECNAPLTPRRPNAENH